MQALPEGGVALAMLASVDAADSEQNLKLTEQYDYLLGSVGIHPENLPEHPAEELERIAALAAHKNCYAIGEIGLDYHYEGYDKEAQIAIFQEQITLAERVGFAGYRSYSRCNSRGSANSERPEAEGGCALFQWQCRNSGRNFETGHVYRLYWDSNL